MAVRFDIDAFRESIPTAVAEAAARLLSDGSVGEIEPAGGGVQAVVRGHDGVFQPWIGIVDGLFTTDCDCGTVGDDFCAHAVATALTAFHAGSAFSGAATPPGATPAEPEHAHYLEAVRRLSPRQLANLVVEHALGNRLFATQLLGEAGLLDPTDRTGLHDARAAIRDASNATTGSRWQISDVEAAGQQLAAEIEILCARPPPPPCSISSKKPSSSGTTSPDTSATPITSPAPNPRRSPNRSSTPTMTCANASTSTRRRSAVD
ncbi:hypothetical protein [Micromonospora sp. RTP1Z1]|uniref:SWIM zinc finger family protein n=1 Tax=Micromonospora sp. RTP1Z1 TaxID=2994043 RepID=UPI0029C879BF|nr:hypothetical protein [Micromonospora sp. RTP1Z1]